MAVGLIIDLPILLGIMGNFKGFFLEFGFKIFMELKKDCCGFTKEMTINSQC